MFLLCVYLVNETIKQHKLSKDTFNFSNILSLKKYNIKAIILMPKISHLEPYLNLKHFIFG